MEIGSVGPSRREADCPSVRPKRFKHLWGPVLGKWSDSGVGKADKTVYVLKLFELIQELPVQMNPKTKQIDTHLNQRAMGRNAGYFDKLNIGQRNYCATHKATS